jgi:hypothetical protein
MSSRYPRNEPNGPRLSTRLQRQSGGAYGGQSGLMPEMRGRSTAMFALALSRAAAGAAGEGVTVILLSLAFEWVGLPLALGVAGAVIYRAVALALPSVLALVACRSIEPRSAEH